jgi:hypothetical protein
MSKPKTRWKPTGESVETLLGQKDTYRILSLEAAVGEPIAEIFLRRWRKMRKEQARAAGAEHSGICGGVWPGKELCDFSRELTQALYLLRDSGVRLGRVLS